VLEDFRPDLEGARRDVGAVGHDARRGLRDAPPAVSGRRIKIRYIAQPKARPPFFVLFGNSVESIPESYKRYLVNGLRETFGLFGVPIRLSFRSGEDNPYAPKKRRG
jgi:GTPase